MFETLLTHSREMPLMLKLIVFAGYVVCTCWFGYWTLWGKTGIKDAPPHSIIRQNAPNSAQAIYAPNTGSNSPQTIAPQAGTGNTQIFNTGSGIVNGPGGVIYYPAERELLPGTKITEKQLRDRFPFGYVVFAKRNGKWAYEADADGAKWDIASVLTKTEIIPDFGKMTVTWNLPGMSVSGGILHASNLTFGQTTPMNEGHAIALRGILLLNVPVPYIGTISADQVAPVFIVGFRIPPQDMSIMQPLKI